MDLGGLIGSDRSLEQYADGEIEFDESEVNKYAVRRHAPGKSGAQSVSSFGDLDEPISKASVEQTIDLEGLPYGEYKLYALGGEQNHVIGTVWSLEAGDEDAVVEDEGLEAKVDALRQELRDDRNQISHIRSPDDAFGALFERVLAGDDLDPDRIDQLEDLLLMWVNLDREPTPDRLAAQIVSIHLERGDLADAQHVLGVWLNASGGQGESLIDLAREGDFSDFDGTAVRNLAMLRLLDDPQSFIRDAGVGVAQATARSETPLDIDDG